MNLSFRLCTEDDLDAADAILVSAYRFQGSRKALLQRYLSLQADGWWLALLDGTPVGFGGAVSYGAFSSLGMLSVTPACQRRGIGTALTQHILSWTEAQACPTVILEAEDPAVPLYARLGFVEAGETLVLLRDDPAPSQQGLAGVEALHRHTLSDVCAFDSRYFGADRAKIFQAFMLAYPGRAFLTRDDQGHLTGYLFAQPRTLGPWIATTPEAAEALLLQALTLTFEHGPDAAIPTANAEGVRLLHKYRFKQVNRNHAMWHGAPAPIHRALIYAQTSPALG